MAKYSLKIVVLTIFIISCTSENGDDLKPDCSSSDLSLTLVENIDPSCDVPGFIEVAASLGGGEYEYSIDGMNFSSSSTFSNLSRGGYNVIVRDAEGCTEELEVILAGLGAISFEFEIDGCGSGTSSLIINASGGDGNYTYQLNDGEVSSNNVFEDLSFGLYSVTVFDGEGCFFKEEDIQIGVSLANDIYPIIEANCAINGCHLNVQSPRFETEQDVIESANRIKARTGARTMPPTGPLASDEIQLIAQWVDCGALDN